MSDPLAVTCFKCGCHLGTWSPGAIVSCWHCGQQIVVRSQTVGLGEALATAAIAIGIGVIVGVAIERGLKALNNFLDSL